MLMFIGILVVQCLINQSVGRPESPDSANLPNILFIVLDDLGWKDLGYKGAEYSTPILDELVLNGIDLQSYYVHPMCTPTRASFFTARWAFRTGLQSITTMPSASKQHIDEKHITLSQVLNNIGYINHFIGKWHLGYAKWEYTPLGKGFDTFYGMLQGYGDYYKHSTEGGYDFWDMKQDISRNDGIKDTYSDLLFRNRAIKIIEQHSKENSKQPLFMYLSFQSIHTPMQQSPLSEFNKCENTTTRDRQVYCNKILAMDQYIGDVKNSFIDNGLWDKTLVIVSTDNGGLVPYAAEVEFGSVMDTHGYSVGNNLPLRGGKSTMFEGGVRGTGFLSGPVIPEQLRGTVYHNNDFLIHAIDWFPTILHFIGKEDYIPDDIDGVNVWESIMLNGAELTNEIDINLPVRKTIYSMISFLGVKGSSIIDNGWKLINSKQLYNGYYDPNAVPMEINDINPNTERYLFNIYDDPNEENNLINKHCNIAKELQTKIFDQVCKPDGLYIQQTLQVWKLGCPSQNEFIWYPWMSKPGYNENDDQVVSKISTSGCRVIAGKIGHGGDDDSNDVSNSQKYQDMEKEVLEFYNRETPFWNEALTKVKLCKDMRQQIEASFCEEQKNEL